MSERTACVCALTVCTDTLTFIFVVTLFIYKSAVWLCAMQWTTERTVALAHILSTHSLHVNRMWVRCERLTRERERNAFNIRFKAE